MYKKKIKKKLINFLYSSYHRHHHLHLLCKTNYLLKDIYIYIYRKCTKISPKNSIIYKKILVSFDVFFKSLLFYEFLFQSCYQPTILISECFEENVPPLIILLYSKVVWVVENPEE